MIQFPFIGQTHPGRSIAVNPQRTINLFPEIDKENKSPVSLSMFPGYETWTQVGNGPIRGGLVMKGYLYLVSGAQFFKVSVGGTPTPIGTIDTGSGRVSMDHNGTQIAIADGTHLYIYDGTSLSIPAYAVSTAPDQVVFHDSYFIGNEPGSGRMYRSSSYDGKTWSAANTATAEFKPDNIITLATDRDLWVFGEYTTEPYYNSATAGFSFRPRIASRMVFGIAAKFSWARTNNTSFWLAKDENGGVMVVGAGGSAPQRVSTAGLEYVWSTFPDVSDAFAQSIFFKGHQWYVLTFPSADHGFGRSYVYDSNGFWFEIGEYRPSIGEFTKHPMECHFYHGGKHLIGDINGTLYEFDDDIYTNNGDPIYWERVSPVVHENRERLFHSCLEIDMEVGVGTATGDGISPQIIMQFSDDKGYSWSNNIEGSMGAQGEHLTRVRFPRLGATYDRVYRIRGSAPTRTRLISGNISV